MTTTNEQDRARRGVTYWRLYRSRWIPRQRQLASAKLENNVFSLTASPSRATTRDAARRGGLEPFHVSDPNPWYFIFIAVIAQSSGLAIHAALSAHMGASRIRL